MADEHQTVSLLRQEIAELRLKITELEQKASGHQEGEQRFRLLYERAPLGYQSLDQQGNFLEVNQAWLDTFGYRREDVIGRWFGSFLTSASKDKFLQAFPSFQKNGEVHGVEFDMVRQDGTTFAASFDGKIGYDEQGRFQRTHCILTDITERKRAEAAERAHRTLAEALRDAASALTGTLVLNEVLDRVLENVGRVVPHDAASILLIDSGVVRVVREKGALGLEAVFETRRFAVADMPNWQTLYDTGQPVVVFETHNSAHWKALEHSRWINSFAGAPIRVDGRVIGFLNLYSGTPGFFTQDHADPLLAFADQAAIAIKNARLYNEIQSYAAELEQRVMERTAQLNLAKEHVEAVLNSSSDMILSLDRDGTIQQANPIFNQTFDCAPGDMIGLPLTLLAAPESVPPLREALRAAVEHQHPQRLEMRVQYKDHAAFDVDVALSPIVQADGQVSGLVCGLHDITVLKQTETGLRRMLSREIELNDLKSRFISTASHEFRTPLAIIQSSSDVLDRYCLRLTEEQKQNEFHRIRASIAAMVALLDDMLTISRADQGKLDFAPEPVNLETFCRDMIAAFEMTNGRHHAFVFSHTGAAAQVSADPRLLRHIIGNLLSNAVKYSAAGSLVTFDLAYESRQVLLRIKDQGIGIPAADQARLFEPFHRAQNVGATPGTGLGLAIVRRAVDLHQGTIVVESREGIGTTFTVTLPGVVSGNGSLPVKE